MKKQVMSVPPEVVRLREQEIPGLRADDPWVALSDAWSPADFARAALAALRGGSE